MKKILVFLFFLVLALSSRANDSINARSNNLLRFVAGHHGLRNYALYTLVSNRCDRYMDFFKVSPCQNTVGTMLRVLDFDLIFVDKDSPDSPQGPESFVFVAFKKNLVQLLSSPTTGQFLEELHQKLNKYLVGELTQLNIWELALKHYGGPLEAAKVMAALFQDTSLKKLHLAYLDQARTRGQISFESNKELLSKVIDTINLILDYSDTHYRHLFYPKEIQSVLNRNIYHFYVPLYLAMALQSKGASKEFSYQAPLLLTLTYEFVTASHDYRYLYVDPINLDSTVFEWKIKDIYGGYAGSNYGLGRKSILKFEEIKNGFKTSTNSVVLRMLK